MHKLSNWLKNKSPKQLLFMLLLLYLVVIIVVGIFFILGRINLVETAITYGILFFALVPLVHQQGRK